MLFYTNVESIWLGLMGPSLITVSPMSWWFPTLLSFIPPLFVSLKSPRV